MGTLWSELGPVADAVTDRPRIYADANVPAGIVTFMRDRLRWDVLSVMDQPDLRRARDIEHFRLARQLRRTLVTLDRDYLDDRKFPPAEGAGVLVVAAADERGLAKLLARIAAHLFASDTLPLDGRKLHAHSDWAAPQMAQAGNTTRATEGAEGTEKKTRATEGKEGTEPGLLNAQNTPE
jgi:hypothetical protein